MTDTKSFRDNKVTTLKSSSENNMEPVHIFYRELPTATNNIFTANIAKKKNEVENVKFKTSVEYAVTGLSINQNIDSSLVAVTDTETQYVLSNVIQNHIKETKEPNFDLKIYSTETSEVTIPLQKKPVSDITPVKLTFYNIITKKQENVEFYNYIQNLEKYDFAW